MSESERRYGAGMIHEISAMLGALKERVDFHGDKLTSICEKIEKHKEDHAEFLNEFRQHVAVEEKFIHSMSEVKATSDKAMQLANDLDDTRRKVKYGLWGAASVGAAGGTGISGFVAWLKGWL